MTTDPEKSSAPAGKKSSCHPDVAARPAEIFLVRRDGSTLGIGFARYCPASDWTDKRKHDCFRIVGLQIRADVWPKDLPTTGFKDLVRQRGPGFWIQSGFHLIKHRYEWVDLHDELQGVPEFEEGQAIDPAAQQVLKFRQARGRRPEPQEPEPVDRMKQASGEKDG